MKTREKILKILKTNLPYLNEKYGVGKIGLFGSYSRGEAKVGSDIDLLVEFERPIGFFKSSSLRITCPENSEQRSNSWQMMPLNRS